MYDGRTALTAMCEGVYRWFTDLTYRMRPEHPLEDVTYIPIAAEAERQFLLHSEPMGIVVWNTFKGKRERYYDLLSENTAGAELILLQEFRHDPRLEASHRELFAGRDADMAVSFYTRPNRSSPTGVCTVSSVRATKTIFLLSRYFEPVTKTPKIAILQGHEGPDLRHERDEPDLSQDRRLAGHVRAGEDDHPRVLRELQVVGDELLARHHPLDHGMAPRLHVEAEAVVEHGTGVSLARRDVGQRREHVELGDGARHALEPRDLARRAGA